MSFYRINSSEPYIINTIDGVDASDVIGSASIGLAIADISNAYGPDCKLFRYVDTKARLNLSNGASVNYYDGGVLKSASFEYRANNLISLDLGFILLSSVSISAVVISYNGDLYLADGNRHYLYLMSNGNYCISSANRVGETVSWYPGGDTVTFDDYIGEYIVGSSIGKNIDKVENEVSITINPTTLYLDRNSGTTRTLFSDYVVDIKIDDSEYENVSKYFSGISPNDDAVTIVGILAGLDFNTDNLSHSEYVISFSEPKTGTILNVSVSVRGNSSPYEPGGTSSIGGGGGNFGVDPNTGLPFPSDDVTPDIPNGSVSANIGASRMFTHYACNISDVSKVADILWSRTFHDALEQLYISAIYGKPAELVIGLMSFPFDVSQYATTLTKPLFLGDYNTGENFLSVTSNAFVIDWGSINISEYWGNFLDYAPHTKIELYLPWSTGFISIDPNDCTPGTISIKTNVDVAKGTCVHNVVSTVTRNNETTTTIIGTYSGQCGRQIPIIGNDYVARAIKTFALGAAAIAGGILLGTATGGAAAGAAASTMAQLPAPSSAIGIGAGTAIGPFTGNIGQSVSGGSLPPLMHPPASPASPAMYTSLIDEDFDYTPAMKLASSTATMMTPVTVSRNGAFTDGNSEMTIQYPYVVISRPMQSIPSGYGNHYGYPSNITAQLGQLKGYTEVGSVHLNGLSATANEIRELTRILQGGFII